MSPDNTSTEVEFDPWTSQQLVIASDPASGLRAVIAMDDLSAGPGFGGVRFRSYPSAAAAVREAQRLAAAMTLKHALAELPYGGAKSVILDDGRQRTPAQRLELFQAFGKVVAETGGRYIPGVDMGTTLADMSVIRGCGAKVYCADHDPGPWTALGVFCALRAAVQQVLERSGEASLSGVRVAVQGAGSVGGGLARLVAEAGGQVVLADVDLERARAVAAEIGAEVVPVEEIVTTECDVFAPCAVARVITRDNIDSLRCRIVCGAANDTLDSPDCDAALREAGITFVPDFVANAGGVIHEHGRALGWDESQIRQAVEKIGPRVQHLAEEAPSTGGSLVEAALAVAARRLGH